jgi:hypothetical protein
MKDPLGPRRRREGARRATVTYLYPCMVKGRLVRSNLLKKKKRMCVIIGRRKLPLFRELYCAAHSVEVQEIRSSFSLCDLDVIRVLKEWAQS